MKGGLMAETGHSNQQLIVTKRRSSASRVLTGVISWVAAAVEVLLAFRFGLLLLGANPEAGFVDVVYWASGPFMSPFDAVFGVTETRIGSVFEWSALLAIIVYAVVAWGLRTLVDGVTHTTIVEEVERVEREPGA